MSDNIPGFIRSRVQSAQFYQDAKASIMNSDSKFKLNSHMKVNESSSFDSDRLSGLAVIDGRNPITKKD